MWRTACFLSLVMISLGGTQARAAPDTKDPCYAPTKQLTPELRQSFVTDVSLLAAKAEADHGVPSAILAAMSIIESGYGTTQLAIATHNVLSYKWSQPEGPDGRKLFTLACQPSLDRGNTYVVFRDRADAADFVAGRLARSRYYSRATSDYMKAVGRGANREAAARVWLRAIAPSYNPYQTNQYVKTVLRAADDPIGQSGRRIEPSLWRLAPTTVPLPSSGSPIGASRVKQAAEEGALTFLDAPSRSSPGKTTLEAARYMAPSNGCDAPDPHWGSAHPGFEAYSGLPVTRCEYSRTQLASAAVGRPKATLLAVVWMLNADAPVISRWVGFACQQLNSNKPAQCGRLLAAMIVGQNGAQFPVAGHVLETQSEAGCDAKKCPQDYLLYLPFRDGITVTMASDGPVRRRNSYADFATAATGAYATLGRLGSVQKVGRIANIGRPAGLSDNQWLARNRDSYLAALRGGDYTLLVQSASAFCSERIKGSLVRDCGL